jgi:O-6-methylguanine DNA methyltransferase
MAKQAPSLEHLQTEWKELYQNLLPEAARSNSPAQVPISTVSPERIANHSSQSKWPVTLDHCFARIILDHTVGINTPWPAKIKSPAYKNMSVEQLEASNSLGRKILKGKADLVDLDRRSLELRGKRQKVGGRAGGKRKREGGEEAVVVEVADTHEPQNRVVDSAPPSPQDDEVLEERSRYFTTTQPKPPTTKGTDEDFTPHLKKIALSHKTLFQKKVLSLLCQIPRGRYTTYAAISKHLSSSPRAVGNAIRNNPFAPQVPCHRVLASGGGIGGFHGSWGRNGQAGLNDDKKRKLLREEGVRFDGAGKVVGGVWEGFK